MKEKLADADAKREAGIANFKRARRAINYGKFASNEERLRLIDLVEKIQHWHASTKKAEREHAGQEILVRLAAASEKQRLAWAQFFENAIARNNKAFFYAIGDILAAQRHGKRGYYYTDESQQTEQRAMDAYDDFIDAELRRVAAKLKEKLGREATNDEIYEEMRKPQPQNITKKALWDYLVSQKIFFVRSSDKQKHRARLWKKLGLQEFPQAKAGPHNKKHNA
jgi:hypothetical protein